MDYYIRFDSIMLLENMKIPKNIHICLSASYTIQIELKEYSHFPTIIIVLVTSVKSRQRRVRFLIFTVQVL